MKHRRLLLAAVERAKRILGNFLISSSSKKLHDALVTDAKDQMSFEEVPFATMTLLSSARFASGLDSQKEGDWIEGGESSRSSTTPAWHPQEVWEGCVLLGHHRPNRAGQS